MILDGHVGQRHALDELAEMAGLSRSYFSRTFHEVVDMTLRDYLRAQKLARALELVRTSRRSLTDIAVESGFYDLPHLDKVFRQRLGTSPYNFRSRHTMQSQQTPRRSPPTLSTTRRHASALRRAL